MQIEDQSLELESQAVILVLEMNLKKLEQLFRTSKAKSQLSAFSQLRRNMLSAKMLDTQTAISFSLLQEAFDRLDWIFELDRLRNKQIGFFRLNASAREEPGEQRHVPESLIRYLEGQKMAKYQKGIEGIRSMDESETRFAISRLNQMEKMIMEEIER